MWPAKDGMWIEWTQTASENSQRILLLPTSIQWIHPTERERRMALPTFCPLISTVIKRRWSIILARRSECRQSSPSWKMTWILLLTPSDGLKASRRHVQQLTFIGGFSSVPFSD